MQEEGEYGDPANCAVYYRSVSKTRFLSKANSLPFVQGVSMVRQRGTFALRDFSGTNRRGAAIGDTLLVVGDCNGCFGIFQ